jgi:pyruvate/2-oxoacid:ferredoxin oxidoreductase beta subunit
MHAGRRTPSGQHAAGWQCELGPQWRHGARGAAAKHRKLRGGPHLCFTCGAAQLTACSVTSCGGNSALMALMNPTEASVVWSTIWQYKAVHQGEGAETG